MQAPAPRRSAPSAGRSTASPPERAGLCAPGPAAPGTVRLGPAPPRVSPGRRGWERRGAARGPEAPGPSARGPAEVCAVWTCGLGREDSGTRAPRLKIKGKRLNRPWGAGRVPLHRLHSPAARAPCRQELEPASAPQPGSRHRGWVCPRSFVQTSGPRRAIAPLSLGTLERPVGAPKDVASSGTGARHRWQHPPLPPGLPGAQHLRTGDFPPLGHAHVRVCTVTPDGGAPTPGRPLVHSSRAAKQEQRRRLSAQN